MQSLKSDKSSLKLSNKILHQCLQLSPGFQSRRGVVDKTLALYPGVLISIPGSTSLSGETFSRGPDFWTFLIRTTAG